MWTYETELMEHDKPYGGGDMRIHARQVMVFKPIGPEQKFKPMEEWKNPEVAEPTEPWMNDIDEISNRATIRLLRGDMGKGIRRIFEKPGQNGAWWLSPDWQTIYLTTDWSNYKLPMGPDGYGQRWHALWKSVDGGQHWQQLPWPERTQPGQPLFMADGQRGYLVADGMRIWRTSDGGLHWQALPLPAWANQRLMMNPDGNGFSPWVKNTRARFDAFDVSEDGTLRVAFYVRKARLAAKLGEVTESTLLYSLPFTTKVEELPAKWMQPDAVFKQQSLMDIKAAKDGGVHLIALQGQLQPDQANGEQQRLAAYVHWQQGKETFRHVFAPHVIPGALFIGRQDQLVLAGESQQPDRVMRDSITLVSSDGGRSWDETNDGSAYAWYYETETNRIWKYEYHSLYWRKLE
ncbi:hypothetical protein QU481_12875 [Crenobacter sp. SG2303]|uniref:Sialidase domain-containing protein n=1 Tax=Crenobacter oryzisoli TaxID=3056844 RepID=A0ABT7XPR4_9NEIS|nr:hypothetical protein [Crenobacter sp. SG2303]MDN0075779.1 hypothetical protein [Crenobacter sp. SG2303]